MRRKALPPVEGAEGGEDDSTYSVYGEILLDNRVTAGRWGLDPRTWCPNIISDNHAIDQLKTKKSCKSTLGLHARIVYSSEHIDNLPPTSRAWPEGQVRYSTSEDNYHSLMSL